MNRLTRLVRCELKKMRHSLLLLLHLVVPFLGALVFLFYYHISAWSGEAKVDAYMQVLAVSFPFLIGLICPMSIQAEEEGKLQTFFMLASRKYEALLAKWFALLFMGAVSTTLTIGLFALGYPIVVGENPVSASYYIAAGLVIWASQGVIYLIHLFLSLQFGKSVSIGAAILGTVLSAIMLTGLGEGRWFYIPYGWGGRLYSYLVLYSVENTKGYIICSGMAVAIIAMVFCWFQRFEGRKCQE